MLEWQINAAPEITKAGFSCRGKRKLTMSVFPYRRSAKEVETGRAEQSSVSLDFVLFLLIFLSTNVVINNNVLGTCLGETWQLAYLFGDSSGETWLNVSTA